MEKQQEKNVAKLAAYVTLLGSGCMLTGAAILGATGVDLDLALYDGEMAKYLQGARSHQNLLIANLSIWIAGVILIGVGANLMATLNEEKAVLLQLVRYNYSVAVPLVVVAYMAWLAVVVRLASSTSAESALIAEGIGWFAVRADWVATALVLGVGPALITSAGRGTWVPNWLRIWSYIALLAGIITTLAQYTGGLTTYGLLIIPIGMGWMIAASITLLLKQKSQNV